MENKKVKKVIVELEDGNKMEFTGDVVMFAEDEMSGAEKLFKGDDHKKLCGVIQCPSTFLATVTNSVLHTLAENSPGFYMTEMMKQLDDAKARPLIMAVLANILDD